MALLEETFQELQTDILSYYCLTLVIKIAYKHLRKPNCIGYFLNDLSRCNIGTTVKQGVINENGQDQQGQ